MADAPGDRDVKLQRIANDFLSAFKDSLHKLLYTNGEPDGETQKQSSKSSSIALPIRRELPIEDVERCVALVCTLLFPVFIYTPIAEYP